MLIVLWSTPRTGSTWYSNYLIEEYKKQNITLNFLKQYFNKFQYTGYVKQGSNELFQTYSSGMSYIQYKSEAFTNKITSIIKSEERKLLPKYEEAYRIGLLEKVNLSRFPYLLHQHVQPMSKDTYFYLKNKATKNIYLYRENIIDQLASYVVAIHTQIFHRTLGQTVKPVTDAYIDESMLESLYNRIIYWHDLDKTNCDIIKYEDIDFSQNYLRIAKQHKVPPIEQVSEKIRNKIYTLNDKFNTYINQKKTLSLS
jgi:hypothetical protein